MFMNYKKKVKLKEQTVLKAVVKKVEKPKLFLSRRASMFLKQLKQDFQVFAKQLPLELAIAKKLYAIYYTIPHRVINTALYQHTKSRIYLQNILNCNERFSLSEDVVSNVDQISKQLAKVSLNQQFKEVKQNAKRVRKKK